LGKEWENRKILKKLGKEPSLKTLMKPPIKVNKESPKIPSPPMFTPPNNSFPLSFGTQKKAFQKIRPKKKPGSPKNYLPVSQLSNNP